MCFKPTHCSVKGELVSRICEGFCGWEKMAQPASLPCFPCSPRQRVRPLAPVYQLCTGPLGNPCFGQHAIPISHLTGLTLPWVGGYRGASRALASAQWRIIHPAEHKRYTCKRLGRMCVWVEGGFPGDPLPPVGAWAGFPAWHIAL